jgi:hypothetical protein
MKRTYQPKKRKRKRVHGFMKRMRKKAQMENMELPDEVILFIASNIKSNIHDKDRIYSFSLPAMIYPAIVVLKYNNYRIFYRNFSLPVILGFRKRKFTPYPFTLPLANSSHRSL